MRKVSLADFSIPNNYVLIKPDPDFEFIEVPSTSPMAESTKIWIGYDSETIGRHYGITGTVLVVPENLKFNKPRIKKLRDRISNGKNREVSDQIVMANLVNSSLSIDVDMELQPTDKVWFDYMCQINAVVDRLLIDTEEHGMCFLVKYEDIYCLERDGELKVINGWVWVQPLEKETTTDSGLEVVLSDTEKYLKNTGVIVNAAAPIKGYLDYDSEDPVELNPGDEVIYNEKIGFPVEYSVHRKLTDKETYCIRRKDIYAVV